MNSDKRNVYLVLDEWKEGEQPQRLQETSSGTSLDEVNSDWDSVVEDEIRRAIEQVEKKLEGYAKSVEPVESKGRPGFIPYTDGGWNGHCFIRVDSDTSNQPKPREVRKQIENTLGYAHEEAVKEMKKRYATRLKDHGITKDDQINYHDLYDAKMGDIAEALDETERSLLEDNDLMCLVDAYYYGPENSHNDKKGGHTLYVVGGVNWEAPYYRSGKSNEWVSKQFTFNFKDEGDLRNQLSRALRTIVGQMV